MQLKPFEVLSNDDINQIAEATFDILANSGVKVLSASMFNFLKSKGLPTDDAKQVVKMPRQVIEDALASVPRTFDVYDREGNFTFTLGLGKPKIAAGHNAVFWVDSDTGATRPSTVEDVEQFAKICEALPNIDMIGIPVMPQNVTPAKSSLPHGVAACMRNSKKPIYFSTDRADVNLAIINMLKAVFPGDLTNQVYGISQLSPTSPLYWEENVCDAIRDTVENDIPLAILPEPNAGVSAPFTLAGLLTINNAECLSGIVMAQLIKKGAKVLYANSWTTTDMRSGAALVGSIETSLCRIAASQLAKHYNLPCHTTAPNSDNHAHDEQNSWEKTFSQLCAIAAGNDLVVNCGMFATGMTCSHEQLLMDEEITAMCRRLTDGIEVNDDTVAKDLIKEIGPAGEGYLTSDHTLDKVRSDEFFVPLLAVRGNKATWEANGSPDTYQIAKRVIKEKAYQGLPLEQQKADELSKIIANFT